MEDIFAFFITLLAAIFFYILYLFVTYTFWSNGYKQGQTDAIKGKINYELKENKDGEQVWTKIENE